MILIIIREKIIYYYIKNLIKRYIKLDRNGKKAFF